VSTRLVCLWLQEVESFALHDDDDDKSRWLIRGDE
jgi:hypothetical protein